MKTTAFCFLLLLLLAPSYYADTVVMNNGAKYGGIITEYLQGKYILKNKGKKYSLTKDSIKSITWSATQAQLNEAFSGEKWPTAVREKKVWPSMDITAGYMIFLFPNITADMQSGMPVAGYNVGGYSKDNSSFMLDIKAGYMSGELTYREPNSTVDEVTSISTFALMFVFDWGARLAEPGTFMVPFINFGAGVVVDMDSLDNYPMGWESYKDTDESTINPDWIYAQKVDGNYLGLTANLSAGLDFSMSESLSALVKAGLVWMRRNKYDDVFKYSDRINLVDANFLEGAAGISLEAGIRFVF